MTDNPLAETGELRADELWEQYQADTPTVSELTAALKEENYSDDQLRALREAEQSGKERKTALEALDKASTDGEDVESVGVDEPEDDSEDVEQFDLGDAEANTSSESPALQRAIEGAGGTPSGVQGLNLPDPYGENAPETVTIETVAMVMSFAGMEFEPGEHEIGYNRRVKQALESENNNVALTEDDPLHPEVDDE